MGNTVYLDTETTGLAIGTDEILELAIVDQSGSVLLNTLVKPSTADSWPEAQEIHGISPAMVSDAPLLADIGPQIAAAVKDKTVVIYNASFDAGFLHDLLDDSVSVECCMQAWSEHKGYSRWQKLIYAANEVHHQWTGEAHRALADAQACRSVWLYMVDPEERARVDAITTDKANEREAKRLLRSLEWQAQDRRREKSKMIEKVIEKVWLKQADFDHWTNDVPHLEQSNELSKVFYGKPLALIELEDQFSEIYSAKKAIPEHLKPASYFCKEVWFKALMTPCAAYVGKKTGWPLYDIKEVEQIQAQYALRFAWPETAADETLMNKTELKKAGYSECEIQALEPVAERQNQFSGDWYYLYKVSKKHG